MAFEIIPKKTVERKPWLDWVFYFSLILLIISVLGYFVLEYSLKNAEEEIKDLENKISEQNEKNRKPKEELLGKQKKIDDFAILLEEHKLTSQVFTFIENSTHPEVSFIDFDFNSQNSEITLSGETSDFKTLGEQLLILQRQENIEDIGLSDISLVEKGVDFSLDIVLNPELFSPIR